MYNAQCTPAPPRRPFSYYYRYLFEFSLPVFINLFRFLYRIRNPTGILPRDYVIVPGGSSIIVIIGILTGTFTQSFLT